MLSPSFDAIRLKALAAILDRYGFGDVVHRLGLGEPCTGVIRKSIC